MSSTQLDARAAANGSRSAGPAMRLEVVVMPVRDVERAKAFYAGLGWRLDGDFASDDGRRVVQLTPPGSTASIVFGAGVTSMAPGSVDRLLLAVDDIDAAREDLRSHGVDVGEVFHDADGGLGGGWRQDDGGRAAGHDPHGRSYGSYATFSDPDGNVWLLQQITERLPGRVSGEIADLAELLHDAETRHGAYEGASAPHNWWDWYAAYMDARRKGNAPEDAERSADAYMADVKGVAAHRG
jgi:catechol 2,3-dioxygenase-like lactoylglutathione lyase family enzyme